MPPRAPIVVVFIACFLSAAYGGGFDTLNASVDLWNAAIADALYPGALMAAFDLPATAAAAVEAGPAWVSRALTGRLYLSLGDALALGAAVFALPDAGWRPARRPIDKLIALGAAVGVTAAMAAEPRLITPSFSILVSLAWGDALAALGARRRPRVEAA